MPRQARLKSESGVYHIIMRGINRKIIFKDSEDFLMFIYCLQKYKGKSGYEIYAYCLMNNHIHILIKIGDEPLEQVMRRICGKYVYWYNQKYERIGNLFQDRFKSEPVENDTYFLTVLRYIHQNPLKAGIVGDISQYKWSSYHEYLNYNNAELVDVNFSLKMFHEDKEKAVKEFIKFNAEVKDDRCLEVGERKHLTDKKAKDIIDRYLKVDSMQEIEDIDKKTRNKILSTLKKEHGLSIRQIERLTGIQRGIVSRA